MPLHYGKNAGLSPEASIKSGLAAGLGLALVQPRVPQHPSTLEEVVDTETWRDDSEDGDGELCLGGGELELSKTHLVAGFQVEDVVALPLQQGLEGQDELEVGGGSHIVAPWKSCKIKFRKEGKYG